MPFLKRMFMVGLAGVLGGEQGGGAQALRADLGLRRYWSGGEADVTALCFNAQNCENFREGLKSDTKLRSPVRS